MGMFSFAIFPSRSWADE